MGQYEHRGRHQDRQLRAALRARSSRCGQRRARRRAGLERARRSRSPTRSRGKGLEPVTVTRGFLYSVRVRFSAMDPTGRVVASLDTTRHFVAPEPVPDGEHLVGRIAVPVPTGPVTNTGWPSSRARKRAWCCRATRCGWAAELGHARPQRPGARQPQHQSGLAANRPGHRPLQSAADVQAQRGDAALLRGRGPAARAAVRGAARGAEAGWERGSVPEDLRRRRRGHQPQVRRPGHGDASSRPIAACSSKG